MIENVCESCGSGGEGIVLVTHNQRWYCMDCHRQIIGANFNEKVQDGLNVDRVVSGVVDIRVAEFERHLREDQEHHLASEALDKDVHDIHEFIVQLSHEWK